MTKSCPVIAVWLVLFAAFVVLGIRGIVKRFDPHAPHITSSLAGIDVELERLLEVHHGSDLMLQIASRVPPDKPVMVVGPGMDFNFCETYCLISYLLWPRPVWALGQVSPGEVSPYSVMPKEDVKPALMLLYLLKPPGELAITAQSLGPNLSLVVLPENNP